MEVTNITVDDKNGFFDKDQLRYDCQSFETNLWQKRLRNFFSECPASGYVPLICVSLLLEVRVIQRWRIITTQ